MTEIERCIIMGSGPGGIAAAAGLARKGYDVRLFNRREETIKPLIKIGGVEIEGDLGEEFIALPIITTDIEKAIQNTQLICIVVPGYGQRTMFEICRRDGSDEAERIFSRKVFPGLGRNEEVTPVGRPSKKPHRGKRFVQKAREIGAVSDDGSFRGQD